VHKTDKYSPNGTNGTKSDDSTAETTLENLNLNIPNRVRRGDATSAVGTMSPAMLIKMEAASLLDQELYVYAQDLFWEQAKESLGASRPASPS
jgi:hypothetical protein